MPTDDVLARVRATEAANAAHGAAIEGLRVGVERLTADTARLERDTERSEAEIENLKRDAAADRLSVQRQLKAQESDREQSRDRRRGIYLTATATAVSLAGLVFLILNYAHHG